MPIELTHCSVEWTEYGALTRFKDGTEIGAYPHPEMPHYHVIAHRCGYGDDLMGYCREHEFCHSFLAQELIGQPSRVLWHLAHGWIPGNKPSALEEMTVHVFQRYLRGNEEPIISGVDWGAMKREALALLSADLN